MQFTNFMGTYIYFIACQTWDEIILYTYFPVSCSVSYKLALLEFSHDSPSEIG